MYFRYTINSSRKCDRITIYLLNDTNENKSSAKSVDNPDIDISASLSVEEVVKLRKVTRKSHRLDPLSNWLSSKPVSDIINAQQTDSKIVEILTGSLNPMLDLVGMKFRS